MQAKNILFWTVIIGFCFSLSLAGSALAWEGGRGCVSPAEFKALITQLDLTAAQKTELTAIKTALAGNAALTSAKATIASDEASLSTLVTASNTSAANAAAVAGVLADIQAQRAIIQPIIQTAKLQAFGILTPAQQVAVIAFKSKIGQCRQSRKEEFSQNHPDAVQTPYHLLMPGGHE